MTKLGRDNIRCVVCQRRFNQDDANHYDDAVPRPERWTCTKRCHISLLNKGEQNKKIQTELASMNMSDPSEALGLSPAQQAKEALAPKPVEKDPIPVDDEPADEKLLAAKKTTLRAAGEMLKLAVTLDDTDLLYVAGLAVHLAASSLEAISAELGLEWER